MCKHSHRVAPLLFLLWTTACRAAQAGDLKDFYPSIAEPAETNARILLTGSSFSEPGPLFSTVQSVAVLRHLSTEIADQFDYDPVGSTAAAFTYKFDPNLNAGLRPLPSDRGETTGEGKLNLALPYSWIDDGPFQGQRLNNYDLMRAGAPAIVATPTTENITSGSIAWEKSGSVRHSQLWLPVDDAPAVQSHRWIPSHWHTGDLYARCGDRKRYQDRERNRRLASRTERQAQPETCGASSRDLAQGELPGRRSGRHEHRPRVQTSDSAQSSSYGDLVLRPKTNLFDGEYGALTSRLDFYVSTGAGDELRGLGYPAAGASLIYATALGHFSPHASLGLLWRFDARHSMHFALGGDIHITPWLTATTDVALDENTAQYNVGNTLFSVATGIKVNPWRRVVLSTNLFWRPNDQGISALANIGYTFR